MEIKANKVEPQTVECFSPEGVSLGKLNEYEFNDLRIQIMNNSATGYYCVYNNLRYNINEQGRTVGSPFILYDRQINELLGI